MSWKEKRRDDRFDLFHPSELKALLISRLLNEVETPFSALVRNISLRGCRLVLEPTGAGKNLKPDATVELVLIVKDVEIRLQTRVVREGEKGEVAFRFLPPFPSELGILKQFLEPRRLGRSLREIDPQSLQSNTIKNMRWFQGINETHLFSWGDKTGDAVTQQQLIFAGQVVEWRLGHACQTGRVQTENSPEASNRGWIETELLNFDASPNRHVLEEAVALMQASRVDKDIVKIFLEKLKGV